MTNETFDADGRRRDPAADPALHDDARIADRTGDAHRADGTAPTARLDGDRTPTERVDRTETAATDRRGTTADGVEPTRIHLDPTLDQHQRQGLSGGTWIALILGTIILILLLIFILQNNVSADFAYLGFEFSLPLGVAMLFAAIAGVLITALLGSVRLFKLSRRVRRLEKERQTIRQAIR